MNADLIRFSTIVTVFEFSHRLTTVPKLRAVAKIADATFITSHLHRSLRLCASFRV